VVIREFIAKYIHFQASPDLIYKILSVFFFLDLIDLFTPVTLIDKGLSDEVLTL